MGPGGRAVRDADLDEQRGRAERRGDEVDDSGLLAHAPAVVGQDAVGGVAGEGRRALAGRSAAREELLAGDVGGLQGRGPAVLAVEVLHDEIPAAEGKALGRVGAGPRGGQVRRGRARGVLTLVVASLALLVAALAIAVLALAALTLLTPGRHDAGGVPCRVVRRRAVLLRLGRGRDRPRSARPSASAASGTAVPARQQRTGGEQRREGRPSAQPRAPASPSCPGVPRHRRTHPGCPRRHRPRHPDLTWGLPVAARSAAAVRVAVARTARR